MIQIGKERSDELHARQCEVKFSGQANGEGYTTKCAIRWKPTGQEIIAAFGNDRTEALDKAYAELMTKPLGELSKRPEMALREEIAELKQKLLEATAGKAPTPPAAEEAPAKRGPGRPKKVIEEVSELDDGDTDK